MLSASVAAVALAWGAPGLAQQQIQTYDLPAQPLGQALAAVGRQSGRQIVAPTTLVAGKTAPALKGAYNPDQAYAALLAGSGLRVAPVGDMLVLQTGATPGEARPADAEVLSEVLVTGTRIRGAAPVGSNLITIGRDDIEASGYATTQQIVQSLSQNYGGGPNEAALNNTGRNGASANLGAGSAINLRGLGAGSTLVLLNGARPAMGGRTGVFADVSLIPTLAIQRVEVLADGASALYGSDAVAGVVNFILRDRYEGASVQVRYGDAKGGGDEQQFGLLTGHNWSTGHLVAAYEVTRREALPSSARAFATSDLRAFGGGDYRSAYAAPGTIVAGGVNFAIPAGQTGVGLRPDQLQRGVINLQDGRLGTDLLPRQTRQALYLSAEQGVGDGLVLFAQALAADRRFRARITYAFSAATVPVTNPFYVDPIGTRQPVRVQYNFSRDLGPMLNQGHVQASNVLVGAKKQLGSWEVAARAGLGWELEQTRYENYINTYRLNLAVADTDPSTAYNVFGGAGATNAATINAIRGFGSNRGLYEAWSAEIRADGPIFQMPAGQVRLALGAEHRDERYKLTSLNYLSTAAPSASQLALPGPRQIDAAYAELHVPLVGGMRALDLSLAGRIERHSDFGVTRNPKIGLDWRPLGGVLLKMSYGTSFRAPSFNDQRQGVGSTVYQPTPLSDPRSPTGSTIVLALLGNAPQIGPERAKTWTSTLELKPTFAPGLSVNLSYFKVRYQDRIASINGDIFNALINRAAYAKLLNDNPPADVVASYYASPYFTNPTNIAASSVAVIVDARTQNLARVVEDGVDLDIGYRRPLAGGDLSVGVAGTYLFDFRQAVTINSPAIDSVGTLGSPLSLRWRARATWRSGSWDAASFVNFTDGYTNTTVSPNEHVRAWTTVDFTLGYRFADQDLSRGVRVSLAVSNLFDRDPPFVNLRTPSSGIGYDSDNASALGRTVALQVTKSW